jgi:cytochrome c oxidase assembly protein subunit 11
MTTSLAGITKDRMNKRIVVRLVVLTVFMFGFGYALVPIYDTFCVAFGLNGKTGITDKQTAVAGGVDDSRWITVQFTSHTATGLPWEFKPVTRTVRVHPGAITDAVYFARNNSSYPLFGRATYSVAPAIAATHFKKTECFCFTNQLLKGGERRDMPVRFVVDRDIPEEVRTITLSYSFFNAQKYLSEEDKNKLTALVDGSGANEG